MQNRVLYDDPIFFEEYRKLRERDENYNNLLEQPAMRALLPPVEGKTVLDLGCGFGLSCADFARRGAKRVLGVDVSRRMLEYAQREHAVEGVEYRKLDLCELERLKGRFDLVYSSLAFHYVEDFSKLIGEIVRLLKRGGILLFSQEHPVTTATKGYALGWNRDPDGRPVSYTFSDYHFPGRRESFWFVDGVVTYHRTTAQIVNTLAEKGFCIEAMDEAKPSESAIRRWSYLEKELLKPNFLLIRARKR